ncbi:MAG TPA: hypothetical protein VGI56_11975 [Galbitalea sp.]|jgi:hypothetical protein
MRGAGGLLAIPIMVIAAAGAIAGIIIQLLIKLLWFVLVVAPIRVCAGIREGNYNNRLSDAEDRIQWYLDGDPND